MAKLQKKKIAELTKKNRAKKKLAKTEIGKFQKKPLTAPEVGIISGLPKATKTEAPRTIQGETPAPSLELPQARENVLSGRLGFEQDLFADTLEEQVGAFKKGQAEELERFELEKSEMQKEIDKQRQATVEQTKQTTAGIRAGFAEDREGVQTTARPAAGKQFQSQVQRQLDTALTGFVQRERAIGDLEKQLEEAQKQGRQELVIDIQTRIDEASAARDEAKIALEESRREARKDVLNIIDTIGEAGLATLDSASLANIAAGSGIPQSSLLGMQTLAQQKIEAQKGKDEREIRDSELAFQTGLKELEDLGKTDTTKALEGVATLQAAFDAGEIDANTFESLKQSLGFAPKPIQFEYKTTQDEFGNDVAVTFNPETGEIIHTTPIDVEGYSETAPRGGYRTDRHNNPTAIAYEGFNKMFEQIGYVDGVDFKRGDAFPNNNKMHTIKFDTREDGIKAAIDLIDNFGFYTSGGQQRWTHTAMSKSQWDSLNPNQKRATINNMYKKEGGNGYIFGASNTATDSKQPERVEFKEELVPLYIKFNEGKLTSADRDSIKAMRITQEDFAKQALASKGATDARGNDFAFEIIELAGEMKSVNPALRTQLSLTGQLAFPGSPKADFKALFDKFKSKLSLQNLVDLKANGATFGALSDNELKFITDASTLLRMNLSEEVYQSELDKIIDKMKRSIATSAPLNLSADTTRDQSNDENVYDNTPDTTQEDIDLYNNLDNQTTNG